MQNNEKRRQAAQARKSFRALQAKLRSIGGTGVEPVPDDPHIELLLRRGRVMGGKPCKMVRGRPSQCHYNAAARYVADFHKYHIVTGYGLSADDGLWRSHSWLWDEKRIVETTAERDIYFGVVLDNFEAAAFVFMLLDHVLPGMSDYLDSLYPKKDSCE